MEIASINHTISFLGMRGATPRDPISPTSYRRFNERSTSQPTDNIEPAVTTRFSDEALERARDSTGGSEHEPHDLSEEERAEVRKLKERDQEVQRHEQAHKAAAGSLASGAPTFAYTRGPDGKQYAVSGEVQIDVSPVSGDAEATIRKMRQVQSAARAPANPSGADLKVASSAARQEASARAELRKENDSEQPVDHHPSRTLPDAYRGSNEYRSGRVLDLIA